MNFRVLHLNVLHEVKPNATYGDMNNILYVYDFLILTHKNVLSYVYVFGYYNRYLMFVCCCVRNLRLVISPGKVTYITCIT